MQYYVEGTDGKEYGPVDFQTLQDWVTERRVLPDTTIRDALAGLTLPARQVSGLFPEVDSSMGTGMADAPPSQPYGSGEVPPGHYGQGSPEGQAYYDKWALPKVIGWNVLGLGLHFGMGFAGFIITGLSILDGFRLVGQKHPHGWIAVGLSVVSTGVLLMSYFGRG